MKKIIGFLLVASLSIYLGACSNTSSSSGSKSDNGNMSASNQTNKAGTLKTIATVQKETSAPPKCKLKVYYGKGK